MSSHMFTRSFVVAVVLAAGPMPTESTDSKQNLRGGAAAESTQQAAKHAFLSVAARLAAALRHEIDHDHEVEIPVLVVAARDRLGQEADKLQEEDPAAALLLRDYASRAPPSVLIFGPEDIDDLRSAGLASSNSEVATIIQSDGHGHIATRTLHCPRGECVQRKNGFLQARQDQTRRTDSLATAIDDWVNEMRGMEGVHGLDGFHSIMSDAFGADGQDQLASSITENTDASDDHQSGLLGHSIVSSSETAFENGRMVEHTTNCEDGKCVQRIIEGAPRGTVAREAPESSELPPGTPFMPIF